MKNISYAPIYNAPYRRYHLYKGNIQDSPQHPLMFHMVHLAVTTHKNAIIYFNSNRFYLHLYDGRDEKG